MYQFQISRIKCSKQGTRDPFSGRNVSSRVRLNNLEVLKNEEL